MCAPYLEKNETYIFALVLQLCQILTDFNKFYTAETGNKCTKQGMHLIIYYIKKVLLMT